MNMARRIFFSGASLALSSSFAFAQTTGDENWMWNSGWGWGNMMFGGGILMLVFWGGIILLIVLLARGFGGLGSTRPPDQTRPTAQEILKERFARGDIDKQEYEERRKTLGD